MNRISNWRALPSRWRSAHSSASPSLPASGAVGEQVQQAALLAGHQQLVEARAEQLLGRVAEHALARRALVDDGRVGPEHGDEVAGVLHERGEASLAATVVDLLGQRRALQRERELGRERAQRAPRPAPAVDDGPAISSSPRISPRTRSVERDRPRVWSAGRPSSAQAPALSGSAGVGGRRQLEQLGGGRRARAARRGRRRGRGERQAALVAAAQQRDAGALEQRADGVERGTLRSPRGWWRRRARRRRAPSTRSRSTRALLLAHEAGHARDDEREQHHRGADDHDQVGVAVRGSRRSARSSARSATRRRAAPGGSGVSFASRVRRGLARARASTGAARRRPTAGRRRSSRCRG